jgi:hypothetical protein
LQEAIERLLKESFNTASNIASMGQSMFVPSYKKSLMSQEVQQEALARLLIGKGIFSQDEFLEMVRVVDGGMKRKRKGKS